MTSRTDLAPERAGPRGALHAQVRPRLGQDERICPSSPQEKQTRESDSDMAGTLGGGTTLREKQPSDSVQAMLQTKQVLGATQQANRAGAGAS